jgi:hypothetical protein
MTIECHHVKSVMVVSIFYPMLQSVKQLSNIAPLPPRAAVFIIFSFAHVWQSQVCALRKFIPLFVQQWLTQDRPVANVGSAVVSVVAVAAVVVAVVAAAAPVVVVARTKRRVCCFFKCIFTAPDGSVLVCIALRKAPLAS